MNPAFSTGLVIPTCTARQCKGKRDKRLNTPDIDFATCFQQILAPPKQTLSTCRPGGMSEGEPTLTCSDGFYKKLIFFRCPRCKPRWGHDR